MRNNRSWKNNLKKKWVKQFFYDENCEENE